MIAIEVDLQSKTDDDRNPLRLKKSIMSMIL